jgi:type I restriction enzyme S subunit
MSVEGWKTGKLRDITVINYGKSPVKILSPEGQYPVVGTGETERLGTNFLYDGESIILGRKGSIDRVYFASGKFWAIDTAYYLSDFRETFPRWLFYYLQTIDLRQMNEATGVPSLSREFLYNIALQIPAKAEQTQIATILSTIDRAIEQTEALIAKQQRIKTGLMQDLLTKGIDENGNIRSEETHEFKDSPLGRIPVEWEVKRLGEIGEFANGVNKSKEHFGFGTKFVNISDVYPDHLDVYLLSRINVSKIEIDHYGVEVGDILMDRSSVKLEGVGYPTVFEGYDEPVVFCGFIIRFRPLIDLNSRFICLQMRDESFRIEVLKVATQSANVNVNQESLSQLYIKLPSKKEQDLIVNKERKIDMYLECLNQHLLKLRCNKTGLMQDLLTGKVRVTDLLNQNTATN